MRVPSGSSISGDHPQREARRILFVSQWYAPEAGDGGVPRGIATALRDRGHNVEVLTGLPNYPDGKLYPGYRIRPYQREERDELTIHRAPLYFSHDTNARRRATNYLSFAAASTAVGLARIPRVDVSLVYSSPITAALPAMALRAVRRIPYVLLIQDMWPQSVTASGFLSDEMAVRAEGLLHRFCDRVYRGAAQIAVTSPGMIDLVAARGVPHEKLQLIPNWADEDSYRPVAANPALRQEFGLTRPFTVMYAGNLGEVQGLNAVLDAAALLRERDDIGFAFVGHGAAEQALRATAAARQLDNVVFVAPQPVDRMATVLAAADVQLVSLKDDPLFRNTLPSKIQSLLAAGRPIVGFISGDAAQVIADSGAGMVAHPGRPSELAAAISQLFTLPPGGLAAMGDAGRKYYIAHFSARVAVERLEHLISVASHRAVWEPATYTPKRGNAKR